MARHVPECIGCGHPNYVPHDETTCIVSRHYDLTQKIAGWHFAKEALSKGERQILAVAEQLERMLRRVLATRGGNDAD